MQHQVKPSPKEIRIMPASSVYQDSLATRCTTVFTRLMKHVTTRTVAVVMFVALDFLSSTHGKDPRSNASAPPQPAKAEIVITNFIFSPSTLTVPAGSKVTWLNKDNVPHVITSPDNQFAKSPVLRTGQSFSHRFTAAGSYSYFCSIHPKMTGRILVK
jgi:Plastocyanin